MKVVKCPICKKKHKVFEHSPRRQRKTCSPACHKALTSQKSKEAHLRLQTQAEMTPEEITERAKVAQAAIIAKRYPPSEPRRKCPECGRRVRLFNSVAGAVWLRAHGSGGVMCEGSRTVVTYAKEPSYGA